MKIALLIGPDGDTLFFFNYRSDRMREIVSVVGLPDRPMEVTVPKDLVCRLFALNDYSSDSVHAGHNHHVTL